MKIAIATFRGEAPRVSPAKLPDAAAQKALCAKLLSGDLEAWRDLSPVQGLAKGAPIVGLFLMDGNWLHWSGTAAVDVVPGPVPGDTHFTTVLAGGGYGTPQITFLDWATNAHWQGSAAAGAYPYKTEALGVAVPAVAPSVTSSGGPAGSTQTFSYSGASKTGWQNSDYDNGAGSYRHWNPAANAGFQAGTPAFQTVFAQVSRNALYTTTNFDLDTAANWTLTLDALSQDDGGGHGPDLLVNFAGTFDGFISLTGPYIGLSHETGTFWLNDGTTTLQSIAIGNALNTYYRFGIVATAAKSDGLPGFNVTATLALSAAPGSVLGTVSGFVPYSGSQIACNVAHRDDPGDGNAANFCDIVLTVSQPASAVTPVYTDYVYTYMLDLDGADGSTILEEESAPSPPSQTVQVDNGQVNSVSIAAPPMPVSKVRIYRAVSGTSGTLYLLVAEVTPAGYPYTYTDNALSAALSEPLVTAGFDPPPANLQGLVALPNGILAGFFANTLALSAQNFPYAWPQGNQYTTNAPIVALGAIDATVLILTESNPYTAYGDTPDAFVLTKEEFSVGCVSKRSVAFRRGLGILYASPEGIAAYAGQGRIEMLTRALFTREQWQALNPSSILGVVHDDRYYFWYDTGAAKGGYVLDAGPDGFGLVELDFHATAAYVDPLTDTLYACVDSGVVGTTAPAGNALLSWDTAASSRPYVWRGRLNLLPAPAAFQVCQVKAADYADLQLELFMDGIRFFQGTIASDMEFALPACVGRQLEAQVSGTSRVYQIELAETVEELA